MTSCDKMRVTRSIAVVYIYFWLSSLCVVIVVKKAMSLRKFHAISLCKLIIVYSFFDI